MRRQPVPSRIQEHHLSRKKVGKRENLRGFSLLELLVVMGILSLLIMLLLPAIVQSRSSARRLTCMNHLRQLSLAMTMQIDQADRFPAAGLFGKTGNRKYHNWVTSLLPQLDQTNLFNSYDLAKEYLDDTNFALTRTPLPVLVCPDDVSAERGEGNLSYVVNGGIGWTVPVDCPATFHARETQASIHPLDLNGNGIVCPLEQEPGPEPSDLDYLKSLSLFFVENWPYRTGTQRFHRRQDVTDGLTTTLMLTENIRAGFDPQVTSSWGTPEPFRTMFFVSARICPDDRCQSGKIDLMQANHHHGAAAREAINAALDQAEGTAPWPSSGHPGQVHVGWCDGHVSPLSENVDGQVYFAIVTPQGGQVHNRFAESVVNTGQF